MTNEMSVWTVRLEDNTCGTCVVAEGVDPVGTTQTVMFNSENGPILRRTGVVVEVL